MSDVSALRIPSTGGVQIQPYHNYNDTRMFSTIISAVLLVLFLFSFVWTLLYLYLTGRAVIKYLNTHDEADKRTLISRIKRFFFGLFLFILVTLLWLVVNVFASLLFGSYYY